MSWQIQTNIAGPCAILELARPSLGIQLPEDGPMPGLINCLKPIISRNMGSVSAFVLLECRFWTRLGSI